MIILLACLLVGIVVLAWFDKSPLLAPFLIGAIFLVGSQSKGENPPPQEQCKHALSACDTYANALEGQVKQLQEEVEAYKKEVGKGQDAPVTLYMALGGAASGGAVGEAWGGQSGGLKGALTGAAVGVVLGYVLQGLAR